jgi:hypothetical protein
MAIALTFLCRLHAFPASDVSAPHKDNDRVEQPEMEVYLPIGPY